MLRCVLSICLLVTAPQLLAQTSTPPKPPAVAAAPQMSKEAVDAFLARPLVARLATVRANHSPHITPMWYLWENGAMYMSTRAPSAKVKHIRKNPRVAVVVDVMEAPRKNIIVTIDGTATILTDEVDAWSAKIRKRYLPVEAQGHQPDTVPRVVLKITPKKIDAIDTTK